MSKTYEQYEAEANFFSSSESLAITFFKLVVYLMGFGLLSLISWLVG